MKSTDFHSPFKILYIFHLFSLVGCSSVSRPAVRVFLHFSVPLPQRHLWSCLCQAALTCFSSSTLHLTPSSRTDILLRWSQDLFCFAALTLFLFASCVFQFNLCHSLVVMFSKSWSVSILNHFQIEKTNGQNSWHCLSEWKEAHKIIVCYLKACFLEYITELCFANAFSLGLNETSCRLMA